MWFNIGLCLSGWCRKMHLWVDYFVTDSQTHSQGNKCMTPVGYQPGFFDCSSKNGECWENKIIKVGCLFTFLIGEWYILPLTGYSHSREFCIPVIHISHLYIVIFIFCFHLEKVQSINECMCTSNLLNYSQAEKSPSNVLKKFADARILPF